MMPNTVSHKTAIALKDAGWEKETERVYNPYKQLCLKGYALLHYEKSHIIAAPTFSEIWEELPKSIGLALCKDSIGFPWLDYDTLDFSAYEVPVQNGNITEAAAQLWLELRKEGLL